MVYLTSLEGTTLFAVQEASDKRVMSLFFIALDIIKSPLLDFMQL
jgi:hypothetical protein